MTERFKAVIGAPPSRLRRVFQFNQAERDLWMATQAAGVPAASRVLDIGAGACQYAPLFHHCRYETQDFAQLDPSALFDGVGYGKIDYVSDITAIPVPDGSYDVAVCTEVLEHVPDPVAAVREFARLLRPGGTLLLTAPLASGIHQEPFHFYGGFTPFWYSRYLSESGFEDIHVEPNGGFFKFYGQESQRFNTMLHPRRFQGGARLAAAAAWALTFPLCRLVAPVLCHFMDRLDGERAFTIGYHVRATRRNS